MIRWLLSKVPGFKRLAVRKNNRSFTSDHFLFVPSYDYITEKMAEWAKSWHLPNVTLLHGDDATHQSAVSKLNNDNQCTPIVAFVGHGSPTELLTNVGLGKKSTWEDHDCLLDSGDLTDDLCGIQIVAWSCSSGGNFGERVGGFANSSFLGFKKKVVMLINPESDGLWNGLIEETISRITKKHRIEFEDKEWLKDRIVALRREIILGNIDTGNDRYDVLNLSYLKWLSKNVVIYIGGA